MARVMILTSRAHSIVHFRGRLIQEMVALGHEVTACAPEESTDVAEKLRKLGACYQSFPMQRTGMNPFRDVLSIFAFVRLFRKVKPDIVLSYTIKPVIYGSLGATLAHVKIISSTITGLGRAFSRETFSQRFLGLVASVLYKLGLRNNTVVFFQNPDDLKVFLRQGLVSKSNQPTLVNGSGVDLDHYSVQPLPQTVSFLLVARMIRDKGIHDYVNAARSVKRKYPEVVFRLVGRLEDSSIAIQKNEIDAWVQEGLLEYSGFLFDVRPINSESTVCVLPSYYLEGTPRSILESMSMGRPIITTDMPGCRETVIDGVNGFLVPPRDSEALAVAMEKFICEPNLAPRMGRASRLMAEEKFDIRKINRIILEKLGLHSCTPV